MSEPASRPVRGVLLVALAAGLGLLGLRLRPEDPMPLGPPYLAIGACVLGLVAAVLAAAPLAGAFGRRRRLCGALAFPALVGFLLAGAELVNAASTSSPVSLTCRIERQEPSRGGWAVTFACAVPGADDQRARGRFDAEHRPLTRAVEARRGALGIWLVPRAAVVQP